MAEAGAEQVTFSWSPETSSESSQRLSGAARQRRARRPSRAAADAGLDPEERRLRWLTADEATAHLGFPSRKALYAAVERGQVPAHRLGRRLRFRRTELDVLLSRGR